MSFYWDTLYWAGKPHLSNLAVSQMQSSHDVCILNFGKTWEFKQNFISINETFVDLTETSDNMIILNSNSL